MTTQRIGAPTVRVQHLGETGDEGIIVWYDAGDATPQEWADELGRELFHTLGRMVYIRPLWDGQPDWATAQLTWRVAMDITEGGNSNHDVAVWHPALQACLVMTDWSDSDKAFGSVIPWPDW